ncbi:hypothetical protein [Comamonas sp. lk]|uniref:hypothetical protein n=1 Tax=Comamonas sp. lk TaxID=2201272 RepID=UPI001F092511|nr:hypothetical protein [Comamonas sp. lk]
MQTSSMRFSLSPLPLSRASLLRAACAAAAMAAFGTAGTSHAQTRSLADISIVERASGRVLPVYRQGGELWVAGRPGANYAVRVRNRTGGRVLGVISVDGVNVLTGKTAVSRAQDGYVFDAGEQADILGWRKSQDQVAAFYFSQSDMSYASRTGRPGDVGVIGVALFSEKPPEIVYENPRRSSRQAEDSQQSSAAAEAPMAADAAAPEASASGSARSSAAEKRAPRAAAPAPSLGTGHGAVENSYAGSTEFESAYSRPEQLVRIRYDSYANLVAKGVIPQPRPQPVLPRTPRAFPGDDAYVPDPPRY